jgi:hypothetical protein
MTTIDWNTDIDSELVKISERSKTSNNIIIKKKQLKGVQHIIDKRGIHSSLVVAAFEARLLFLDRDPNSISNIPVDMTSKKLKKRHCLRFVANNAISAFTISQLSTTVPFYVSPTTSSCTYSIDNISSIQSECTIMDSAHFQNEWWIYIQSSKPTKTSTICSFVFNKCSLDDGCFFTDEIPGGKSETKRYEYTKLQHFKHCIHQLQAEAAKVKLEEVTTEQVKLEKSE